jgi:NAD(P)-dependent dehydrogenase (short-subunit alcohol dehydrogenase family)
MTSSTSAETPAGVAVITGGASGIGLAFARAYAQKGAHVVIGDIDEAAMAQARADLSESGAMVDCVRLDLRDAASVAHLGEVASGFGSLVAVCLNAGVTSTGSTVWETADTTYDFVVGVNLLGLFHSIKTFVPKLVAQGSAADLVITASMAGMVASPYSAVYAASKAGAIALAKSLRAELAMLAPSIRVALLNPGMVKTNLIRTSAARLPSAASLSDEQVRGMHDALNEAGVEPEVAVSWALTALGNDEFWALPVSRDPFTATLAAELAELGEVSSA